MFAAPTLTQLLGSHAAHATLQGVTLEHAIAGFASDSRRVVPGGVFIAVRTPESDGTPWIDDALTRGAGVVVVSREVAVQPWWPAVIVADTGAVWGELAANAWGRPGESMHLAAITGTNGKTTTATLVAACLDAAGLLHARIGTTGHWLADRHQDSDYTTPFPTELQWALGVARARGATHGVMEASSHGLHQRRLDPLRLSAVAMTSFSQDHLDYHPDMAAYLDAKCELTRHYLRPEGVAVAASDDMPEHAVFLSASPSPHRWRASRGAVRGAEIAAEDVVRSAAGVRARVATPAGPVALTSPLVGDFNLDNLLVTIGVCLGLGVPVAAIEAGLQACHGAPGRLERVARGDRRGPVVLVDYAHTPDAVARSLAAVRPTCTGRLVVVLGCGGDRDPSKRPAMGHAAALGADRVWATSDNPRTEAPEGIVAQMIAGIPADHDVIVEVDRARAIAEAIREARAEDTVLIAGKGHETYQIVGHERLPFDDREHARRALDRWG